LALGILLGVLSGVAIAIARDFLDNTVKRPDEMEAITGAGLIGNIPFDNSREEEPAIQFDGDNSAIAEAFRKLRTNLQFLVVDSPPRVIVVTSSLPSEGKSTTALNIALALAEAELNVVIVDGDMRRPMLDKYLDAVGTVGFSTALSGRASLSEVLQKTRFPHLTALTAGTIPPNPSELLGSQAASRILSELREQFDYVIVDSPPLLAVTDGAILATSSDGVLIVGRFGTVRRDQLGHAVDSLREIGANVLGAVFTMTPTRGGGYYSYNYNYGYYGYYKKQDAPATSSAVAESESLAESVDIEVVATDNPK
jgi:receptor protein-tyrosine kinase